MIARALSFAALREAFLETIKTSTMLYVLIIGAAIFSPFLAFTQIPDHLAGWLALLGLDALGTLVVILAAYIVLSMFMDALSMFVISLPIVYPIIAGPGYDLSGSVSLR